MGIQVMLSAETIESEVLMLIRLQCDINRRVDALVRASDDPRARAAATFAQEAALWLYEARQELTRDRHPERMVG